MAFCCCKEIQKESSKLILIYDFYFQTQQHVRIYDLVRQELHKKLTPSCKWISKIAIHPKGDNLLVSTYDKKVMWFDIDLSTKPYQTLNLHTSAVRSVAFHTRYPLFASGSDDRSVIACHGMVYKYVLHYFNSYHY